MSNVLRRLVLRLDDQCMAGVEIVTFGASTNALEIKTANSSEQLSAQILQLALHQCRGLCFVLFRKRSDSIVEGRWKIFFASCKMTVDRTEIRHPGIDIQ